MSMATKVLGAGAFKQGCLALLDDVAEKRLEVVITKRGKPVAKLVPIATAEEQEAAILQGLRGSARVLVPEREFLAPTEKDAGWALADDER